MKRLVLIGMVLLCVVVAAGVLAAAGSDKKIKVMFFRGGGHDWKNCPPIMKAVLESTNDFEITYSHEAEA